MKVLEKIIEYGLYLLAFLLPLQTRWIIRAGEIGGGYNEYSTISLYAIDVLLILLLAFFIIFKIKTKYFSFIEKKIPTILFIIAGFDLAFFISIFLAEDKILAVYKYSFFLICAGVFWLLAEGNYNRAKLAWFLLAGLAIQAFLGIWQFLSQASFNNKWMGMALHDSSSLGVSVIESLAGGRWLRAYGGLDHPNILGAFLAIGIILLIFLFINQEKNKNTLLKIFLLIICPLLTIALFFTFSRAAWLGLILGILTAIILIIRQKNYQQLKQGKRVVFLILIAFLLMFFVYYDLAAVRFSGQARLEGISYNQRIESLAQGSSIVKENWFLGVGAGNYALNLHNVEPGHESWAYQPTHNTFLLIWSEIGIFGLLFFIFLLIYLLDQSLKAGSAFSLAVLISIIFMMNFDHWWWSLHFGFLFLWFILGLLYARHEVQ